ncbi:hypothetical protein [Methylobacterium sp. A54F]
MHSILPVRLLCLALAAALVAAPLANPLLLSLVLILGGVLMAYRGASDLAAVAAEIAPRGEILFRHFV